LKAGSGSSLGLTDVECIIQISKKEKIVVSKVGVGINLVGKR
jgi:hypothetical protein